MTALSTLLAKIDADEVVELTRALIRIPSVHRPGDPDADESRVAAFVEAWLRRASSLTGSTTPPSWSASPRSSVSPPFSAARRIIVVDWTREIEEGGDEMTTIPAHENPGVR